MMSRSRRRPASPLVLVLLASVSLAPRSVHAQAIQLTLPTSLSPSDSTLVYPDPYGSTYSGSVTYRRAAEALTFSRADSTFERHLVGTDYLTSAFAVGTQILSAGGDSGNVGAGGPVTLSFSGPVSELGFGVEEYAFGRTTFTFTAFEGSNALGTFTEAANDPFLLGFIGVRATGGHSITRLEIRDDLGNNIGLGPVSFAAVAVAVPEPPSLVILGTGLLGAVGYARSRARPRPVLGSPSCVDH